MKIDSVPGFSRKIMAIAAVLFAAVCTPNVKAQYAQIVNSLPDILSPALSGSMNYKGYVDVTGTFGVGKERVNFIGVSTTQGFQYSSWFFMGAGIGIDAAMSVGVPNNPLGSSFPGSPSKTKAMLPLFSDFRFNIGNTSGTSVFIDLKAGAAWLLGGNGLLLSDGVLSNNTKFLFRPSIGVRIPTSSRSPKQAVNVGVTYQLLTANNSWDYYGTYRYDTTLSSLGATISYEW